MTQKQAFIAGVKQFCKQAGYDQDDERELITLLFGTPKEAEFLKHAFSGGGGSYISDSMAGNYAAIGNRAADSWKQKQDAKRKEEEEAFLAGGGVQGEEEGGVDDDTVIGEYEMTDESSMSALEESAGEAGFQNVTGAQNIALQDLAARRLGQRTAIKGTSKMLGLQLDPENLAMGGSGGFPAGATPNFTPDFSAVGGDKDREALQAFFAERQKFRQGTLQLQSAAAGRQLGQFQTVGGGTPVSFREGGPSTAMASAPTTSTSSPPTPKPSPTNSAATSAATSAAKTAAALLFANRGLQKKSIFVGWGGDRAVANPLKYGPALEAGYTKAFGVLPFPTLGIDIGGPQTGITFGGPLPYIGIRRGHRPTGVSGMGFRGKDKKPDKKEDKEEKKSSHLAGWNEPFLLGA
jgi:hypothetical protein